MIAARLAAAFLLLLGAAAAWSAWGWYQSSKRTDEVVKCVQLATGHTYVWTPDGGCLIDFGGFGVMTKVNP